MEMEVRDSTEVRMRKNEIETYPANHAPAPPAFTHQIPGAQPHPRIGMAGVPVVIGAAQRLLRESGAEGKYIGADLATCEREGMEGVQINGARDLHDYPVRGAEYELGGVERGKGGDTGSRPERRKRRLGSDSVVLFLRRG